MFACSSGPKFIQRASPYHAGSLCLLTCPRHSPGCFLTFGPGECSRPILYPSCPCSGLDHFSREPWWFLWTMAFRSQDLGVQCAHCHWGIFASRPSYWLELGINTYMCLFSVPMSTCVDITHIHKDVSASGHPCVRSGAHEFTLVLPVPVSHRSSLLSSPFLVDTSLSVSKKPPHHQP